MIELKPSECGQLLKIQVFVEPFHYPLNLPYAQLFSVFAHGVNVNVSV